MLDIKVDILVTKMKSVVTHKESPNNIIILASMLLVDPL